MPSLNNFDANNVDPSVGFALLPDGKYLVAITDSDKKPTRTGNGDYVQLAFEVLEGPCKGRRVWARLNLNHPNPVAVQLARAELSAICRAVGVMAPRDSVDLHNIPLMVTVSNKRRKDTGDLTNVILAYDPRSAGLNDRAAPSDDRGPWEGKGAPPRV